MCAARLPLLDLQPGKVSPLKRICPICHAPILPIALALTRFFLSSQFDNQGLLFGALADLSALPQTQPPADAHRRRDELLLLGGRVLDAVSAHLVRDDDGALSEPISFEMRHPTRCDESHDPAQPLGGGDPFSFKAVFFNQLPRFVEAAAGVLSAAQLERARALTAASAAAAWRSRALPPFSGRDLCSEHSVYEAGAPPKFTWDWRAAPSQKEKRLYTCMDGRTQAMALATFAAEHRLASARGRARAYGAS